MTEWDPAAEFEKWDRTPHTARIEPAYRWGYLVTYERGGLEELGGAWRPTRRWAERAAGAGVRRRNRYRLAKLRAKDEGWRVTE